MTIEVAGMAGTGIGTEMRALYRGPQTLDQSGGKGSPELHKAFTDFVGQTFFGELLKQMRATVGKPAYMHGGMGEDIFQSQLDQVLVERITDSSAATFSDPMYRLMMAPRS